MSSTALSTLILEFNGLAGDCLHTGCISDPPTEGLIPT
jgi:hypothetical protein